MPTDYHLPNIRALLTAGFSAEELRRFCFETPDFRPVYDQLAANTGKSEIIDRLLEFAEQKAKLDHLLTWAKTTNPAQYPQHLPYLFTLSPPPHLPSLQSSNLPSSPLHVFLCHAAADKPKVRELYHRLQSEGFIQPWLDEEDLLPGQDWQVEIPKAVRASDVVLVCLSPQSITKAGYVQKEIKVALDIADEQPEGAIFLIPLRLEPCDVPDRLRRWHWADLFDERGYERLLKSLRKRAKTLDQRPTTTDHPSSHVIPSASEESSQPTPPPPHVIPSASAESPQPPPTPKQPGPPLHPPSSTPPLFIPLPNSSLILELIPIPAGEFLMGSDPAKDKNAGEDEQPQHRVYLSDYYIGKYPITNEQYAVFVKASRHRQPGHWDKDKIPAGKAQHPVVYISWEDATAFCQWLSRASGQIVRLPTEAEWEKAARGPDGRIYPWGNEWDRTRLNSTEGGPGKTTPVGTYSPRGDSPYGLADMAGNVWEWCGDWYDEQEYQRRVKTIVKDPQGPKEGVARVLRGGAFDYEASWLRCAARNGNRIIRVRNYGLRVVVGGPFPSEL